MTEATIIKPAAAERFKLLKIAEDILSTVSDFSWCQSAARTCELLGVAVHVRNLVHGSVGTPPGFTLGNHLLLVG
jgi:hypothetical protein